MISETPTEICSSSSGMWGVLGLFGVSQLTDILI